MALSPEEVIRQNMAPLLDGIINYGRKLGEEAELRDRRAYNEKLLTDQRAYDERRRADDRAYAESIHQKRRGEAQDDARYAAKQKDQLDLEREAASLGVDIAGKDFVDAAHEVEKAKRERAAKYKEEDAKLALKLEADKLRALNKVQQIQAASEAGVVNPEQLSDSDLIKQTAIGRLEQKAKIEDEALNLEANKPIVSNYKNLAAQYEALGKEFMRHESQLDPQGQRAIQAQTYMTLKSSPVWKDITAWAARYKKTPEEALMGRGLGPNGEDLHGIEVTEKMPKKLSDAVINAHRQAEIEYRTANNEQDKIHSVEDRYLKMARLNEVGKQLDQFEKSYPFLLRVQRYHPPIEQEQDQPTQARPGGLPLPTPGSKAPAGEAPVFGVNGKLVKLNQATPDRVEGLFPMLARKAGESYAPGDWMPETPMSREGWDEFSGSAKTLGLGLYDAARSAGPYLFGGEVPQERQGQVDPITGLVGAAKMATFPLEFPLKAADALINQPSAPEKIPAPTRDDIDRARAEMLERLRASGDPIPPKYDWLSIYNREVNSPEWERIMIEQGLINR